MLLPSALTCEARSALKKPLRPPLASFAPYRPIQTAQTALQESSRTLQSIICGASIVASPQLPQTPRRPDQLHDPLRSRSNNARVFKNSPLKQPPTLPHPQPPPRGSNKRSRMDTELEDEEMDLNWYDESVSQQTPVQRRQFSTPKRQRIAPLSLPLGLSADDFNELGTDARDDDMDFDMPPFPTPSPDEKADDYEWTADDDRLLVSTVLDKLGLSRWEWNDCARILGRNKDSLGRRWRLLVGEGAVGLRRGTGRRERTDLHIGSW